MNEYFEEYSYKALVLGNDGSVFGFLRENEDIDIKLEAVKLITTRNLTQLLCQFTIEFMKATPGQSSAETSAKAYQM